MHSLPSRRSLFQPNFFRFKCYRLSPVPLPHLSPPPPPPPPPPASAPPAAAAAPAVTGPLPSAAARLPFVPPPPVPARAHALAHTPPPGAAYRQERLRPPAQTQPRPTPGTERQADAAVRRQGRGTVPQSSNGHSVTPPPRAMPRPLLHHQRSSSSHSSVLVRPVASESGPMLTRIGCRRTSMRSHPQNSVSADAVTWSDSRHRAESSVCRQFYRMNV